MKQLPIHERFYAFQGEGVHMGRSAFFIRAFGCPVQCPWCDSAGTWHRDWVPKEVERMDAQALVEEAKAVSPEFVVWTGGEPTVHKQLPDYARAMKNRGIDSHIETCGGFHFPREDFQWITVSPKREKMVTHDNLLGADEIKLIIDHPGAVSEWCAILDLVAGGSVWAYDTPVWLHPEWSQRENPKVLDAISEAVKERSGSRRSFRAGWQLHKLYQVDRLDPKTQSLAPLGGDPKLGY